MCSIAQSPSEKVSANTGATMAIITPNRYFASNQSLTVKNVMQGGAVSNSTQKAKAGRPKGAIRRETEGDQYSLGALDSTAFAAKRSHPTHSPKESQFLNQLVRRMIAKKEHMNNSVSSLGASGDYQSTATVGQEKTVSNEPAISQPNITKLPQIPLSKKRTTSKLTLEVSKLAGQSMRNLS